MNRKLKKYNLRYEYLKLDELDVREELEKYIEDFESRFNKYYHRPTPTKEDDPDRVVWVNEETGEVRDTPPPDFVNDFNEHFENFKREQAQREKEKKQRIDDLKNRPDKLKKLYKKLAAKVHPDRGGSDEEFHMVNEAYENNNLMSLLTKAGEFGLEYEVDNSDEKLLDKNLTELRHEIDRMKGTLAWLWGTGSEKERKDVLKTVETQTGWKVEVEDLPDDLKPKDDTPKLLEDKKEDK